MIADRGVPRTAADVVHRPRLLEALDRLLPLTVLRAPRGYGKTTLAVQWFSRLTATERAWVSVEKPGTSAEEFWEQVGHALLLVGEGPPQDLLRELLVAPGRPVILVVDDLDRISAADVVDDLLTLLRRYPRLHLLATTRTDVLDHREWLDLDGQVLGTDDLGFAPEETAEVLELLGRGRGDLEVASEQLGGWPIAVRTFALERSRRSSPEENVATALATVQDQLSTTILGMVDDATTTDLVLPTAVIGDFSPTELAALLEVEDPYRAVEPLIELGLISTGAGVDLRFSWPGLIRDALVARYSASDPARIRRIRRDLARGYAQIDENGRALAHAYAAEDWPWLREHLENRWTSLFLRHNEQLSDLVKGAPPGALGDSVLVQSLQSMFLPDLFRVETLQSFLPEDPAEIVRLVDQYEPIVLYDRVLTVVATLRLLGEVTASTEAATKARAISRVCHERRPDDLVAPGASVSLQCGLAWLHAGDLAQAIAEMERAHHYGVHSKVGHILRDSAAKLALVHGIRGDLPQSRLWVGRTEAAPFPHTWATPFIEAAHTSAKVLNAVSVLDRVGALDLTQEIEVLHPREELWTLVVTARAKVALLWGHPSAMLRDLDAAQAIGVPPVSPYTGDLLLAARVDLAMRLGLGSRCAALLDDTASTAPVLQVRRARLALLAGHAESAAGLARAAGQHPAATPGTDLEALVVEAVALHRIGDPLAPRRLGEALAIAGRRLDAFALVPRADLVALGAQVPGADGVLDDPRLAALGDVFPESLAIISLTERERVVLRHLVQGLTLRAIAHRETVSINTVKTQVRSLYLKLGATDREHALQTAEQEGLV